MRTRYVATGLALALGVASAWAGETRVRIASALQGKRGAKDVHPLARTFDAPKGDGRGGAVGVVLNGDERWQKLGTRWSFRYARSGSAWGVQIFHPLKEGQVVICITRTGVAAATPHAWTEIGYGRGDPKRLTHTEDFGELFPLEQDRFAAFVSTLLPDGSYELQVNGRVVVRGRFESASPISFAIVDGKKFPGASGWAKLAFKGHQFSEQWEAGYAGILVEPLDNGQNTVRDLHFSPGIARLKTDEDRDF
jgi:hypothetical protein